MPKPVDLVADIDRRILAAFTDLNVARARFYLTPCGEIVTACEAAESAVNELLELRFSLTHGSAAEAHPPLQAA
ncbi:hypothetical protein [Geodermatophilus sp. URMC 64]